MANIKPKTKTARLNMVLEPNERRLIDRAAKKLDYPPSVWARMALVEKAYEILRAK